MLLASSPAFAQSVAGEARAEAIELDGQSLVVDVYLPAATAPTRAAIIAHGWTRSREQHRDQARALAQAGFVAIVPDLPNVLDLWGNGRLIAKQGHKAPVVQQQSAQHHHHKYNGR